MTRPVEAGPDQPGSLSHEPTSEHCDSCRRDIPAGRARKDARQYSAGGPARGYRRSQAAGSAELVDYLAADHDRIAECINDVVVRRIFAAGLDLQAALGLIGDHRGAGKIYHAIDELDQVIRDIRDIIFDDSPPDSLSCRRGGRARAVPARRGSGASPRH